MKCIYSGLLIIAIVVVEDVRSQEPGGPHATVVNINNISYWVHSNGLSGVHPQVDTSKLEVGPAVLQPGAFFPKGTVGVIHHDGFIWTGRVRDGLHPSLRVGGHTFRSGLLAGRILSKGVAEDPDASHVRIWRIRKDWQTADLTRDAAEFYNTSVEEITDSQTEAVRQQYERDWNEWPWQKGAPFYDVNENGTLEPGEEAGLANADQVVWFVANDLEEEATFGLYGSPPIGIELQVTLWAYKERDFAGDKILGKEIFKRYRIIYKGAESTADTAYIDAMHLGQWVNPEIGDPEDDFVGCDTTLQLGFAYNSSSQDEVLSELDLQPPAIGYTLIQGPIVPNENSVARFAFTSRSGFGNLPLLAFFWYDPDRLLLDPRLGSYASTVKWYYMLKGFLPFLDTLPEPFFDHLGNTTRFPNSGDPVTGTPQLDGSFLPAGERRFVISSGPFRMALGDTQEVITALVGGLGASHRYSVQVMKFNAKLARQLARADFELPPEPEAEPEAPPVPNHFALYQNFPNPFNPSTEIRYEVAVARHINLSIYNMLGQKVKTLVNGTKQPGNYSVTWDGIDERGQPVPSGVYLYRFDAGSVSGTKKMLLVR